MVSVIDAVPNPEHQTLLELRYLCVKSWKQIAEDMNYTPRSIYRLHDEALENVALPKSCQ